MHVMSPEHVGNEREDHVPTRYGDMREKDYRVPTRYGKEEMNVMSPQHIQ